MICATIVIIWSVTEYLCLLKKKVNITKQNLSLWEKKKTCLLNATLFSFAFSYKVFQFFCETLLHCFKKFHLSLLVFLPTDEWHNSWIWTREVWDAETAHQKHTGHFGWHKHKVTENGEGVWAADGIHGRSKVTAIYSWLAVVIVWIFCGGNKE